MIYNFILCAYSADGESIYECANTLGEKHGFNQIN